MIQTVSFAREILLDPSECDSAFFILPQLTRDSFRKKGLFYRTEKIIIENYSSFFSYPCPQRAQDHLNQALDILIQ